jgi:calcineurin-like phosphoesterase family protein
MNWNLDNILVWSDVHFGHRNVMKFCPATRPWAADPLNPTDDETKVMDKALIEAWNKRTKGKTIFMLGDFSFSRDSEYNAWIFSQLLGDKHLILGNHDHSDTRKLPWSSISNYKELKVEGNQFILFHYPISSWNNCRHGSFHLHGHVHGEHVPGKQTLRMLDVAVDNGFAEPISLRECIDQIGSRSNHPIKWELEPTAVVPA